MVREKETLRDRLESIAVEMVERGIAFEDACQEFERHFIRAVLDRHDGKLSRAALALGIHRNTLSKRLATDAAVPRRRSAKPKSGARAGRGR